METVQFEFSRREASEWTRLIAHRPGWLRWRGLARSRGFSVL